LRLSTFYQLSYPLDIGRQSIQGAMRYWDVANQLFPNPESRRPDSRWRRLVRHLIDDQFGSVRDETVDIDVASALVARATRLPRSNAQWPDTLHCIGSLGAGGAERQLVNLLIELADRGHDCQTLLMMYGLEGDGAHYLPLLSSHAIDLRVNNCPIREEGVELIRRNEDIVRLIQRMPSSFNAWTLDLWVDIALVGPSVAHFWLDHCNIWGAPAALLAGVPAVVVSTRNVHPENFPYLYAPYMHPWYVWLAQCSRVHFINNSRDGAESYAEWMDVPRSRFEVVLNGVNLAHLKAATPAERAAVRTEIGVPGAARAVVGAFRMSDEKRPLLFVETFAKAAHKHPDLHCVLMGEGPLKDDVGRRAMELGVADRFHLLGRRTDLPKVLSSMDVFLHTAWWEGTPNVVLEAQQLGLPVVVTKAGGAADAVDHGRTGILVDRENEAGLAETLIEILENLDHWKALAQAGAEFIERRFSVNSMVDRTLQLHRQAVSSSTGMSLLGLYERDLAGA
jgi:glycosyltransferase involved in cell wall biosynthesis